MANSQQTIVLGGGADLEFFNLLQEDGSKLLTEDGLAFLALEVGGGLTFHSQEMVGVSDYAITARLLGGITLTVDLANSQQSVELPETRQTLRVGVENSAQTIRLKR